MFLTSESKKPGLFAVVYHYCNLSRFFWLRRYLQFYGIFCSLLSVHLNWKTQMILLCHACVILGFFHNLLFLLHVHVIFSSGLLNRFGWVVRILTLKMKCLQLNPITYCWIVQSYQRVPTQSIFYELSESLRRNKIEGTPILKLAIVQRLQVR